MTKIKSITAGLAACTCLAAVPAAAQTSIVRNPLYELDPAICEINVPATKTIDEVSPYVERVGPTFENIPDKAGEGFLRVERDHIIEMMVKRYDVDLSYSALLKYHDDKNVSLADQIKTFLADQVAPCDPSYTAPKGREDEKAVQDKLKACKIENAYKADEVRFAEKASALRFRRALLRLFESAEIGTSRKFISVRRNVEGFTLVDIDPETGMPKTIEWPAERYRPLIDARADDVMIRRYILDETAPFDVLCRGVDDTRRAGQPHLAQRVLTNSPIDRKAFVVTVENAVRGRNDLREIGDFLDSFKDGYSSKTDETTQLSKASLKPVFVKSASEFSKTNRDGAEVSLANIVGDNNDTVDIDAAFGFTVSNTFGSKEGPFQRTFSATPFISISQSPTSFAFFEDMGVPGMPDFQPSKKDIAFATISAGLRVDYEFHGDFIRSNVERRGGQSRTSLVGRRRPGLRFGGAAETVTDNFRFQNGQRYTVDFSLPKWGNWGVGFRQRQEILSRKAVAEGEDRTQPGWSPGRMLNGWAVEWDVRPTANLLDWNESGAPFNFTTPDPRDRINDEAFDRPIYGIDFDVEFLKANMFGGILGDSTLKLTGDYSLRRGYERNVILNPNASVEDQMKSRRMVQFMELGAEISHPDFSNLSLGIDYDVGRDFSTFAKSETLKLVAKAKY